MLLLMALFSLALTGVVLYFIFKKDLQASVDLPPPMPHARSLPLMPHDALGGGSKARHRHLNLRRPKPCGRVKHLTCSTSFDKPVCVVLNKDTLKPASDFSFVFLPPEPPHPGEGEDPAAAARLAAARKEYCPQYMAQNPNTKHLFKKGGVVTGTCECEELAGTSS